MPQALAAPLQRPGGLPGGLVPGGGSPGPAPTGQPPPHAGLTGPLPPRADPSTPLQGGGQADRDVLMLSQDDAGGQAESQDLLGPRTNPPTQAPQGSLPEDEPMLSQDSVGGGVVASFRDLPGDGAAMSFPQRGATPQLPVGPPPPPGATSLLDRPLARCAALNPPLSAQQVPATSAPQLPRGPPPPPGATTMLGQTEAARGEDRQPGGSSAGPQSRDSRQGPVPDVSSSCGQGSSWPRARALPQRSLLRSSARAARKGSTPSVAGGAPSAPAVAPLSFGALPQPPEAPPKADWGSLSRYYVGAWPGPSWRLAPPSGSSAPAVPPPPGGRALPGSVLLHDLPCVHLEPGHPP